MTKTIGSQFRAIRQKQKRALSAVAVDAGISKTAVLRVEQDTRDARLSTIVGIVHALGITMTITPDGIYIKESNDRRA